MFDENMNLNRINIKNVLHAFLYFTSLIWSIIILALWESNSPNFTYYSKEGVAYYKKNFEPCTIILLVTTALEILFSFISLCIHFSSCHFKDIRPFVWLNVLNTIVSVVVQIISIIQTSTKTCVEIFNISEDLRNNVIGGCFEAGRNISLLFPYYVFTHVLFLIFLILILKTNYGMPQEPEIFSKNPINNCNNQYK